MYLWGYLGLNKIQKNNSKQKRETIGRVFYLNFDKLSDEQKKLLQELYFQNIRDGLTSKEAMKKAFQIVTCFKM